jgi:hypothetical protein
MTKSLNQSLFVHQYFFKIKIKTQFRELSGIRIRAKEKQFLRWDAVKL